MACDFFLTDAHLHIPREWTAYDIARRNCHAARLVVLSVPFENQTGAAWEAACKREVDAAQVMNKAERAARAAFRRVFA